MHEALAERRVGCGRGAIAGQRLFDEMTPHDLTVLLHDVVDLAAALRHPDFPDLAEHRRGVRQPFDRPRRVVRFVDLRQKPAPRLLGDPVHFAGPGAQPDSIGGDGGFFVHVSHLS